MGRIISFFLDALFPRYCLSCSTEGKLVCEVCALRFHDVLKEQRGDHFASFAYGNPLIRDLIKNWKYDFDHSAFEDLKRLGAPTLSVLKDFIERERIEAITYIPLSKRRMAERGFNQAEMIAEWIGQESGIRVERLLDRKESSGHQAERTDEERKEAMKESPFVSNSPSVHGGGYGGGPILLVDDVWTTGSTMMAAARSLALAQVPKILFYTLAVSDFTDASDLH